MTYSLPRPTGKGVRDLHEKLIREWAPCIAKDEAMRDLVYQKNAVELLPESADQNMKLLEVHSGRGGAVIDHATGLLMAMPDYHADPLSQTTEDVREAEQVERVYAALFEKHLLDNDFWPHVGRDILIYDRAFLKAMALESVWTVQEGYPVRGKRESAKDYLTKVRGWKESEGKFPFVLQHVSAMNILAHLDGQDNVLATIEEKLVTANVLADELDSKEVQEALAQRSLKWYDELTVIEYIDTQYVAYFLADTTPINKTEHRRPHDRARAYMPLRVWEHGLGTHPVVMIPGTRTEMDSYEDRFKGFLTNAQDSLELYDFLLSRLASMVYAYYLPSYEWKLPAKGRMMKGRKRPVMKVNLAGVTVTYDDETLTTLAVPQGLPDATMLLQQCDDLIQRHTLEDVLFGRVQGSAPAFQVNLRINVAKSKLTPIAQHMAQGLTRVGELFARAVEQLGEAVIIDGEKLTVAMAKKYRNRVSVHILPKSPVERSQDVGAAAMAIDLGLPPDWVWENMLDIENPATLRLQNDIRQLEEQPKVKERLMQDALEQLDLLVNEQDMTPLDGMDMSELTPETTQAIAEILGTGQQGAQVELPIPTVGQGGPARPSEASIVGGGPYPAGASPQAVAPRGLLTPKAQPQPGAVEATTMGAL